MTGCYLRLDLRKWIDNIPTLETYDFKDFICDLYDNPKHIVNFRVLSEALSKEYPNKFISVPFVLEMLKAHSDFLKEFKAIRAKAERCWKDVPCLKFKKNNVAYLETIPPIQFCVLDKSYLINGEYQIIYPPKYLVEGVV